LRGNRRLMHDLKLFVGMVVSEPPQVEKLTDRFAP